MAYCHGFQFASIVLAHYLLPIIGKASYSGITSRYLLLFRAGSGAIRCWSCLESSRRRPERAVSFEIKTVPKFMIVFLTFLCLI